MWLSVTHKSPWRKHPQHPLEVGVVGVIACSASLLTTWSGICRAMRDAFRNICDALLDSAACLPCCSCVQVRFYSSIKAAASCPCDCALRLIHLYFHCKHAVWKFESLDFVSVTVRWAVGRGDDYYTLVSTLNFAADLHFILTFLLFCVVFLITSLSSSSSNNVCDWCRQQGSFWVMWPHFNVTVWSRWNQKLLEWKCESKNIAHNLKLWPHLLRAR